MVDREAPTPRTGPKEGDMSDTAPGMPAHITSSLEFSCLSKLFTKTT